MIEPFERSFYALYFDNFFSNQILIAKLFEKKVYAVDAVQSNSTKISKITEEKRSKMVFVNFNRPNSASLQMDV